MSSFRGSLIQLLRCPGLIQLLNRLNRETLMYDQ